MNPYSQLDQKSFWKPSVASLPAEEISGLWDPKFRFDRLPVLTAGSCFAQHFGQALKRNGLNWSIEESGPASLDEDTLRKFNYGVFSFRTGNIYTPKALLQWLIAANDPSQQNRETWEKDGRFYDPMRPMIEPDGFASREELFASRQVTLDLIRGALQRGAVFVFTLGLTESWRNADTDFEYAMCPGTVAGEFDEKVHKFYNHDTRSIKQLLKKATRLILRENKRNKVLLTVSPVPLTATASGDHVLVATVKSKSVLRAAASEVAALSPRIDYFPSYEVITGIPYKSRWFSDNLRSVTEYGVSCVMKNFFSDHQRKFGPLKVRRSNNKQQATDELVCEEVLLEAFS